MKVLGLSAHLHGSSAALVVDGVPVAASQEERFTRKRGDNGFPTRSIRWCLREAGLAASDLDHVVFHEKPLKRFERVLLEQLRAFPRSSRSFARSMFSWLGDRLWIRGRIADELGLDTRRVLFVEHMLAHAGSACLTQPERDGAVLIVDDEGEWATTALGRLSAGRVELDEQLFLPESVGLVVAAVTQYLGFEPGRGGEGRVAELAAHGLPAHAERFRRLMALADDGSLRVEHDAFRYRFDGERLYGDALVEALGPARSLGDPLRASAGDRHHADVAASLQVVLEDVLLGLARRLHERVGGELLCLGGEVAQNARAVGRLVREGPFARVHVPAAPGDEGNALGAALYAHGVLTASGAHADLAGLNGSVADRAPHDAGVRDPWLGEPVVLDPDGGGDELADDDAVVDALLAALLDGHLVGWVRGRAEFGGRSLGHRSLLADPRRPELIERITRTVKPREAFRGYHPAVAGAAADGLLELDGAHGPARVHRVVVPAREPLRDFAPGLLAPDGSVRPVVVDPAHDPLFHRLLVRFAEAAGQPVLLHTSLNGRGDPMLRTEGEARDFAQRAALDALIVERRLYRAHATAPAQPATTGVPS